MNYPKIGKFRDRKVDYRLPGAESGRQMGIIT